MQQHIPWAQLGTASCTSLSQVTRMSSVVTTPWTCVCSIVTTLLGYAKSREPMQRLAPHAECYKKVYAWYRHATGATNSSSVNSRFHHLMRMWSTCQLSIFPNAGALLGCHACACCNGLHAVTCHILITPVSSIYADLTTVGAATATASATAKAAAAHQHHQGCAL